MTAREAFVSAKKMLEESGVAEPEAKAKVIVAHVLDIGYADIYTAGDVPANAYDTVMAMVKRCINGEPVEYVTGTAYFRYAALHVSPDVLIPRKETELVAQQAIDRIRDNGYDSVLDVCTGSGCIAVSIAAETRVFVHACDISEKALAVAKQNAERNGVADRIRFFTSDMFDGVAETYDMIVCNPPYVSEQEYAALEDSVRLYEPKLALAAGDGLRFYRDIAKTSMQYLQSGGALVLEIGALQAEAVIKMLKAGGFAAIEVKKDYQGRDRIVSAHKE